MVLMMKMKAVCLVRSRTERYSQVSSDHASAERGNMYRMIEMSDLFGFINYLEKKHNGLGFGVILKGIII